jgi:hypothetical protein
MQAESTHGHKDGAEHRWRFSHFGGFDQVRLEDGKDLVNLDKLDQKLWVALACPTQGIQFDRKVLDLMDTDKDGRLRVPEVLAATRWACSCLKDPGDLLRESPSLPLSAIDDSGPEGRQLLASARQVLANLGKADATEITVEDTADTARIFAGTRFNGDGIVPPESAEGDSIRAAIGDIVACLGAVTDRSGKPGVDLAKVEAFFAAAQAYSDWRRAAEDDAAILPLGESTFSASAAVKAVRAKVEDYFARCRLVAFDARAGAALNREEKEYLSIAAKDLTITSAEIASLPLARVEAGRPLPLKEGVNPAWADAIARLESEAVRPLLGQKAALSEADWAALLGKLAPFEEWLAAKAGTSVEPLGLDRVRKVLTGHDREAITALIAEDKKLEPEANAIAAVEKLVLYHRHLHRLLTNFVNFKDFYGRSRPAVFQIGTLYLDQRSCELCLAVDDAGRHAALAGMAGTYLAYCDCVRKGSGEKMQIVAAFMSGDSDNLMVGRNGVFYDHKGRDWDATITRIVDNPISVRQAFWSPYKKFVRMIEEQVAKRAAAADAASTAKLETAAETAARLDKAPPAQPKKLDVGVIAAMGVAVGAIGTFLAALFTKVLELQAWQVALVVVAIFLLISTPSMTMAWLKLRRRNLGPILDANGWAINARAKINIPFGAALTGLAKLPPGSRRDMADPYVRRRSPWVTLIVLAVIMIAAYLALNDVGLINRWTHGWIGKELPRAERVEGAQAPPSAADGASTPQPSP